MLEHQSTQLISTLDILNLHIFNQLSKLFRSPFPSIRFPPALLLFCSLMEQDGMEGADHIL